MRKKSHRRNRYYTKNPIEGAEALTFTAGLFGAPVVQTYIARSMTEKARQEDATDEERSKATNNAMMLFNITTLASVLGAAFIPSKHRFLKTAAQGAAASLGGLWVVQRLTP